MNYIDFFNLASLVSIPITLWLRHKGKISSKLAFISIGLSVGVLLFRQWKKNG